MGGWRGLFGRLIMDIKFTVLAKNKEEFDILLATKIIDSLNKITADNIKILTIQLISIKILVSYCLFMMMALEVQ